MFSETVDKIKGIGFAHRKLMVVAGVLTVWTILILEEMSSLAWSMETFVQRALMLSAAALFDGISGLIAILLMFTPKAKTREGSILKGIAVVSLIVAPLLGGTLLSISMALPALCAIGFIVLSLIERSQNKREAEVHETGEVKEKITSAQWWLVALIVAFTIGAVLYRVLMHRGLGHSAAMFLGIPAVLAILLALTPKAKTVTGGILKGITLALLIIAPLLGEGYLCILVASPLFYLVGIVIGVFVDRLRRSRNATLSCLALVLLPMSLEGVIPELSFNRSQTVEVTSIVNAPADAVEHQLALSPDITTRLPEALRIGFPRPLKAWGNGLQIGAIRTIHFAGAEGDPPGNLIMRVTTRQPGFARFEAVRDDSKLTQWIAWNSSEVQWKQLDAAHTRVTWCVQFNRQLDPAWYFTPLERAAVYEATKYLIEANATPSAYVKSRGATE
jgi:hypothetical protein